MINFSNLLWCVLANIFHVKQIPCNGHTTHLLALKAIKCTVFQAENKGNQNLLVTISMESNCWQFSCLEFKPF